ncbi:ArnT family glycosyltransferase [Terrimonas rubra]|uniref:ArnT family glycosyltransferase n=1 Tax=Terrimonas rubra TaxID=1035890 RepID=A0ABW6A825_9BACT
MKTTQKFGYGHVLVLISILLLLPHLQVLPVNIMEARNFITAREMGVDGHWIMTTLNGLPRYEKPPLPTWLTAFSGLLFGFDSLVAMRLPVTLITLLLVGSVYWLSQKTGLSKRQSFHNSLILITSFYIFFAGRDNQWDMYCHSFMMAGIFFLWRLIKGQGHLYTQALLAGVFIGCSVLSKGPVSVYTLLLPFLIAYAFIYKFSFKQWKQYLFPVLLIVLLMLVIGGSWWVYVRYMDPITFNSVAGREVSRWSGYNIRPFYYYWNFFTQTGIWTIPAFVALLYPYMKKRVKDLKAYQFTLVWTLVSLLLLSIIPEKKTRYLLPVLIPLAMNTGFYVEYLWSNFTTLTRKEKWIPVFAFGLLGGIAVLFPVAQYFVVKNVRSGLMIWLIIASTGLFICGCLLIRALFKNNFKMLFYATVALQVMVIAGAFPLAQSFLYNPDYANTQQVKNRLAGTDTPLYAFNDISPEIVWDYGTVIPTLTQAGKPAGPMGILVAAADTALFKQKFAGYHIQKQGYIDLTSGKSGLASGTSRLYVDFYLVTDR